MVTNVELAGKWHSRQRDQLGQRLGGRNQQCFRHREESGRFFWLRYSMSTEQWRVL